MAQPLLKVPDCITLLPLPARSPELNPVERLWLYLKERFLSHRLLDDYTAIEAAIVAAWQRLIADTGRLTSLTSYPWIMDGVTYPDGVRRRGAAGARCPRSGTPSARFGEWAAR